MVLERLVSTLLGWALSKYVENIDMNKLKVGLFGGAVELKHLKLKSTALEDLDLPVQVCYGFIEHLFVKIPWKNIYSEPCIAEIDGVYLIAVPKQNIKYDEEAEKKYTKERIQAELKQFEAAKIKELEKALKIEAVVEEEGFASKMFAVVIKNLQMNIKNIHIRYEDRISNPNKPFSVGVTMHHVGVNTIPPWGEPLSMDPLNLIYKELKINWLCVYWNSQIREEDLHFLGISPEAVMEILKSLQCTIGSESNSPENYRYLIGPINVQANLRVNRLPEKDGTDFSVPKYFMRLDLQELFIRLSKRQYQDIMCLLDTMDMMSKAAQYRKYRPAVMSVKGHAKQWWKYAYTCISEEYIWKRKRDWDPDRMLENYRTVKEYKELYHEKLMNQKPSKEFLAKFQSVEERLDLYMILVTRDLVESKFKNEQLLRILKGGPAEEKPVSGWKSWFWGANAGKSEDDSDEAGISGIKSTLSKELTDDERQRMYKAIGYTEGEAPAIYPEKFIETDIEATIGEMRLEFMDEKLSSPTVMTVSFLQTVAAAKLWPTNKGLRFDLCVVDFIIHGIRQRNVLPQLVSTPTVTGKECPLLQVLFEMNPIDKKVDKRVNVFTEPLSIIYDAQTINSLMDVFHTETEIPSAITLAAQEKLKEFKEVSSLGLQHMLEVRETLEIKVDIKPSRLFIPHSGFFISENAVVVITLGNITVTTLPRTRYDAKGVAQLTAAESREHKIRHSYDHFILGLKDLQVVYAMKGEKWDNPTGDMYFLKPSTLDIDVGQCILDHDPNIPKIKIKGKLPIVDISIYESRLKDCLSLFMSIPLPQKEETKPNEGLEVLTVMSSKSSLRPSVFAIDSIKPKQEKPEKEPPDDFVQFYEMEATFELQEVLLVILAQQTTSEIFEFLKFRLNNLEASMEQYSFNSNIRLSLSSILLQQKHAGRWIDMISMPRTNSAGYLCQVDLTMVEKKSPEFHTKYKSTLQLINVDFTKLELNLHCESLQELKDWGDNFSKAISGETAESDTRSTQIASVLTGSMADMRQSISNLSRTRGTRLPVGKIDYIQMKMNGVLGEISVNLSKGQDKFASLGISGGSCDITARKAYTVIEVSLQGVYINDHDHYTIYPQILKIKDDSEMLTLKMVSFSEADKYSGSLDMSIELSMARLQFIFINAFLMRILDFVNNFSEAKETLIDASQAAAEAAKKNMKNAYENAVRVKLIIDLKAPLIVIPVNKHSYEVFTLDLGHITASNSFLDVKVPNATEPAVLDRLKVNLESLKFSRAVFYGAKGTEIFEEDSIIAPISFNLAIQRNLSSGWFLDLPDLEVGGKLHTIKVSLTRADYYLLMKALEENIGDTGVPIDVPEARASPLPPARKTTAAARKTTQTPHVSHTIVRTTIQSDASVRSTIKFAMTLDSVIVELHTTKKDHKSGELAQEGLAQVTLELISVKGSIMSDSSMHVALILLDCIMDDIRPERTAIIHRYMERKKDSVNGEGDKPRSMIDITFQQKGFARFADIRVSSFVLILNLEHLLKVSAFFTYTPPQEKGTTGISDNKIIPPTRQAIPDIRVPALEAMQQQPLQNAVDPMKLTLNFKCEHPDIVLVERLDNLDTNAIVLDFEMIFSLRAGQDKTVINGSINELQLFSCAYNPKEREDTKCPILNPLTIILAGSDEGGSMKMSIDSTRIKISVSPGTITLLSSIANSLTSAELSSEEKAVNAVDRTNMWAIEPFHDLEYSFLLTELGVEASEEFDELESTGSTPSQQNEICAVKFPEIILVLESGTRGATVPILYADSFVQVTVSNWSSKLHMDGKFMLQMKYFNHRHAIWEPLIEPIAVPQNVGYTFYNWTLNFILENNPEDDQDSSIHILEPEDKRKTPLMSISVNSPEVLNLTFTKKSLDILQTMSTMVSDAIYKPEEYEGEKAPYIVKNDSGIPLNVLLDEEFVLFPPKSSVIKDILLDVNSSVGLSSCTQIEYLGISDETKEKYIHIMIPSFSCDIQIPVMKAAKRFFPLNHRGPGNDQWGIVSDVTVVNGQTVITLRGIIQVQNSFNLPVNIYSMAVKENELHLIGTVQPMGKLNIPLEAIYTQTTELFFSVEGYTVSIVPYVWKDLQNCVQKTKILRCNPKGEEEQAKGIPLFLRAIGELEQIFYENTSRHTILSTCFNIFIRPTVIFKNFLPVDIIVCMEGIADEKILAPADSIHVPTAEPGVSHLVVRIPSYLDREWSTKNLLEEAPPDMGVWSFTCYDNAGLKMDLGTHVVSENGTHIYTIYCPFWMVNKTGLRLAYKRSSKVEKEAASPEQSEEGPNNILFHPPDFDGIIMFSFRSKSFFAKKKSSIRVEDGPWSDKFSLDASGTSGILICKHQNKTYHIGVQIRMVNNALTKEVLFTPFHVLVNSLKLSLEFREIGKEQGAWMTVPPESSLPFWPIAKPDVGKLQVRIAETSEPTQPFPFFKSHNSILKLANKYGAINVDVSVTEGAVLISFYSYEEGMAPVLLINHTKRTIDICEKSDKENRVVLGAMEQALFTWTTFDDQHLLSFCKGKYTGDLQEDAIGNFTVDGEVCYWSSFLYGMQRVFLFTNSRSIAAESVNLVDYEQVNQEIELKVHGVGISLIDDIKNTEILYLSLSGSDIVWEGRKPGKKAFKRLSERDTALIEHAYQDYIEALNISLEPNPVIKTERLTLDFKHMKMLSPSMKELRRCYVEGLWVNVKTSDHLTRLHLKVNRLQVDQQLYDCIFPVILAPVPPPKSVMCETIKPFIEMSVLKMTNQFSHVQQYKYLGVLIQEFHVKVDTGFVSNIAGFFTEAVISDENQKKYMEADIELSKASLDYFVAHRKGDQVKEYYGKLHLSPLKMHLSFSLSTGENEGDGDKGSMPPIVSFILHSFGVTLTDVNDVIFKINYFEEENLLTTQGELISKVQSHYISQILQQLYVLVLGLDVIGNPFGLLLGFKQGATDLFYEPFQGAIRGPGEFAEGLVLGVRSLFGHTVGGTAGAISKMTGAMGKGLAALTFDDDYQRQRREAQRQKPQNMQEGLARSGKGLVMGVVEGIGGVVTKPISGAKEEGFSGFFKGVGKGMVGLVTRPTSGLVDFASGSLGAVKRATEVAHEVVRVRPPRYIRPDGVVQPFSPREAEGNRLLQQLEKGKYSKTDEYAFHMEIGFAVKYKDILLLTDRRIFYLANNDIFGGYQLEWVYKWSEIGREPEVLTEGVRFWTIKQKSIKALFRSNDNGTTLLIDNPQLRTKLAQMMTQFIRKENLLSPSTTSEQSLTSVK